MLGEWAKMDRHLATDLSYEVCKRGVALGYGRSPCPAVVMLETAEQVR